LASADYRTINLMKVAVSHTKGLKVKNIDENSI